MKLKPLALGLALGIVWGLTMFTCTIWALLRSSEGMHLSLLKFFYLGYKVSFAGSIIGLVWGLVDGIIAGIVIAFLYNLLTKEKA